jgi:hypothetical protein
MMSRRRLLLAAAFTWLAIVTAPAVHALSATEQARIERLIKYVESRTDLQFVRNGSTYSSEDAAKFLRGKLDGMGGNVNTASQFIEQIATRSSSSGQPYLVRHANGQHEHLAAFLTEELRRIDAAK